jgi:hypothetical protein
MTRTKWLANFSPKLLVVAIGAGLSIDAQAINFNIGEIEGQLDSSLSVGASWSTASPDKDLVGQANGGKGFTQTNDDGRLNFKKGETFSKIFKGIHDLELRYGDTGVFVRGKYWYDFELKDEHRLHKDISDSNRKSGSQSSGADILDAFVYHNYTIGELPGSVRLGKQVVSWGESTFIGNSINAINPVDVSAFRRPGAEIKEGLIPVNMFYLSQSITDQLSAEAFYQLEWDQTVIDNCGTFFSGTDVAADGCDSNYNVLQPAAIAQLLQDKQNGLLPANVNVEPEGLLVNRGGDRDARNSGQWGVNLRWLGDTTEYSIFAMNYHSRTPMVSVENTNLAGINAALNALLVGGSLDRAAGILTGGGQYFLEYPEDIRLYGVSFSTTLPTGTAWSGELSYRPNMPLQLNTTDLGGELGNTVNNAFLGGLAGGLGTGIAAAQGMADFESKGYVRKEVTQAQTTFTHFIDQVMGAERLTLVGEVGVTYVGGMTNEVNARYGRDATFSVPENVAARNEYGNSGFFTSSSWGYRARAIWDYNNVIAGVNLRPSLAWSHDVDGYGPVFNEGSKAISVGVDAEYLNMYTAGLSYTDFFGGDYNTQTDRDFLALSFGVNF